MYTKGDKKCCAACHGWTAVELAIPEIPLSIEAFPYVCPKCRMVTQWKNYGKVA